MFFFQRPKKWHSAGARAGENDERLTKAGRIFVPFEFHVGSVQANKEWCLRRIHSVPAIDVESHLCGIATETELVFHNYRYFYHVH